MSPGSDGDRRLGIYEVEARLSTHRGTLWRWYTAGDFPVPHYLGKRRFWWLSEVVAWELENAHRELPESAQVPGWWQCLVCGAKFRAEVDFRDHFQFSPHVHALRLPRATALPRPWEERLREYFTVTDRGSST